MKPQETKEMINVISYKDFNWDTQEHGLEKKVELDSKCKASEWIMQNNDKIFLKWERRER